MNARIFGLVSHDLIYLQDQLLAVADMNAMAEFLRTLQSCICPESPMIMVATREGESALHRIINVDWPKSWIELYQRENFALVDPVLAGPPGQVIRWSEVLAVSENYHSRHYRRFLDISRLHGMLAGMSWIEQAGSYRVTISLKGWKAEANERAYMVFGILMPRIAAIVARLLRPYEKLHSLTPRERNILQCLLDGLSDEQSAERTGLSTRTTRERINKIKLLHGASNRSHLLKILFNLELPQL